jgi:hypothetical protein
MQYMLHLIRNVSNIHGANFKFVLYNNIMYCMNQLHRLRPLEKEC